MWWCDAICGVMYDMECGCVTWSGEMCVVWSCDAMIMCNAAVVRYEMWLCDV